MFYENVNQIKIELKNGLEEYDKNWVAFEEVNLFYFSNIKSIYSLYNLNVYFEQAKTILKSHWFDKKKLIRFIIIRFITLIISRLEIHKWAYFNRKWIKKVYYPGDWVGKRLDDIWNQSEIQGNDSLGQRRIQ